MGQFLEKSKGVNLTFLPKIDNSNVGKWFENAKGIVLPFHQKLLAPKRTYFCHKAKRFETAKSGEKVRPFEAK